MAPQPNPLLPAGAVATIDTLLGRLRTDTCQIKRRGVTRDSAGSLVTGGFGVVAVVDCQVTTPGRVATERVAGGRFGVEADYEIRVPRTADVKAEDRITHVASGKTFEVVYAAMAASHAFQLSVLVKASS